MEFYHRDPFLGTLGCYPRVPFMGPFVSSCKGTPVRISFKGSFQGSFQGALKGLRVLGPRVLGLRV